MGGFLKKIFGKKKGGTKIGNLLRGVANKVSGGKLGTGKHMLKVDSVPEDSLSQTTAELIKTGSSPYGAGSEIGNALVNIAKDKISDVLEDNNGKNTVLGGAMAIGKNLAGEGLKTYAERNYLDIAKDFLSKYWMYIVFPVSLVILYKVFAGKFGKKKASFGRK